MTTTKRALAILTVVMMFATMFCTSFAAGSADAAEKGAENVDSLVYDAFEPISNPGYGISVPSNVIFVCSEWSTAPEGAWLYIKYMNSGKVYKLQKGINAFDDIRTVMNTMERDNMIVKFGPGTYEHEITLHSSGMKFYGNFAGVCPNEVDISNPYKMNLTAVRKNNPDLETTLTNSHWAWTITAQSITVDGFNCRGKVTMAIGISGRDRIVENTTFINNIVSGNTGGTYSYWIFADAGTNYGIYINHNRIVDTNNSNVICGGGTLDLLYNNNYMENNTGKMLWLTSCGNYGAEAIISFSYNVVNNCSTMLDFSYAGGGYSVYGAALYYQRVVGNKFYNCGTSSKIIVNMQFLSDDGKEQKTESASKTLVADNEFVSIANTVVPIKLSGKKGTLGITVNFLISVNNNKFIFETDYNGNNAIVSTAYATLDSSRNFYGYMKDGKVVCNNNMDKMVSESSVTKAIKMPYYLDEAMTELSGSVDLFKAEDNVLTAGGFDKNNFTINNIDARVTAKALDGVETVDFTNTIVGTDVTLEIYRDFLLTSKVIDNKIDVQDENTNAYLIATDDKTGQATRYDIVILADTDKTKAEFRSIDNDTEHVKYTNYVQTGNDIDVTLDKKYMYFPFTLVVSPSATYTLYTDEALTQQYDDASYYMQPDKPTVLYAKVLSGNGQTSNTYKLTFTRQGDPNFDARILSVDSPTENILLFNNERKSIVYRPYGLVKKATFDFTVTKNAKYTIYKNYNSGILSDPISSDADVKEVEVPDGLSYYYVAVESTVANYTQVYTLTMYNDIKSDDNVITDITSLDGVTIKDHTIRIEVNTDSLANVNAHFETSPFADVVVYADKDKTYKLTPNITTETINNREVEVRTFALGIDSRVSLFWVDVTSETGKLNSYDVIVTRGESAKQFTDTANHWSNEYVNKAARLGIIGGYKVADKDEYTFKPDQNASRQEVAAMLLRSMGIEPLSFKNVALGTIYKDGANIPDWSYNYIRGAYALNIMKGDNEGNFRYADKITRQEFFQAISNMLKLDTTAAANYDITRFSDYKSVASWALPATKAVIKAGIVDGSNGKLNPKANITRAEIAKILSITNTISGKF